jgi:hypothetical protein
MSKLSLTINIWVLRAVELVLRLVSFLADPIIDGINLRRMGYKRILFAWTYAETGQTFSTRREAILHMQSAIADQAVRDALEVTIISGKSRNADCLCGSGLKYKKCCFKRLKSEKITL